MNELLSLKRLPVAVVAYNRPDHLRQTLNALANTLDFEMVDLSIHIDGARGTQDRDDNLQCVRVSHEFAESMRDRGLRPPAIDHQQSNRGLYRSILTTVEQICSCYGRCVVLEDDLLVAPSFVRYMHQSLQRYEGDKRVVQIAAHSHDQGWDSCSFLPLTSSWGWATWHDRWSQFGNWLEHLPERKNRRFRIGADFDFGASYPFSMLELIQDKNYASSWGIRFYRFAYEHNMISLFPQMSLVTNIGFDGSGEHCGKRFDTPIAPPTESRDFELPEVVEVDEQRVRSTQRVLRGRFRYMYIRYTLAMVYRWTRKAYLRR